MVDLPAPFWPISACTSPAATLRFALRRAGTPPKLIWMSCISRSGERPALGDGGVGLPDCVTSILLLQMLYGGRRSGSRHLPIVVRKTKRSDGPSWHGHVAPNPSRPPRRRKGDVLRDAPKSSELTSSGGGDLLR